ncbi:MAG: hypothetical protein AAF224_04250 [Pseudomonadota bacterium]
MGFRALIGGLAISAFICGSALAQLAGQTSDAAPSITNAAPGPSRQILLGVASVGVVLLMGLVIRAIFTSPRMGRSSLFNRLFVVVATTSAFFSGVSSAIGFGLITSQENDDFFRNAVLPPAFGVFVFFLAVTIWVGGAEFVRHRDWFRGAGRGFVSDMAFFVERAIKLFVVIPVLAIILFFVSTWTTVVGIGGVDAVRHTYNFELQRLQSECAGITAHRQKDFLFLEDLRLAVGDVARVARNEAERGSQTGAAGRGAVAAYFSGVAEWLAGLEQSVSGLISAPDPSGADPYDPAICPSVAEDLAGALASNAFDNYDLWARDFESGYDDFAVVLNRWRRDRRIETLLEQQLSSFERANPKPVRASAAQEAAINRYTDEVESALRSLIRKQKAAKPPAPLASANELSPERGLSVFVDWLERDDDVAGDAEEKRVSRTAKVVYKEERIAGLSTITPRDAVLKNANIFSDIWALAIAWDYASYILMLAFLFFPSAERAMAYKDD